MRILVSGASGMIGTELCRQLEADGHTVLKLVRRRPAADDEFNWAPASKIIDFGLVDSVDAVINLSGATTGRIPWTKGYRAQILDSRVTATQALAEAMSMAKSPPAVFLSASAVGYYGDQPGARLTEQSPKGTGFLADVVETWERTAQLAPTKTRVVTFRTGLVVGRGGAFTPLVPLTKIGLGSRFGTGGQHWPWISLHDEAAAIRHLLTSKLNGPVNLVGPTPAVSDRVTRSLAKTLHRWHPFVVPEFAINLLGDAGHDLLLASQKVVPVLLEADGFEFRDRTVEEAIEAAFA
jgi:uncharacterized protein